jgi:hypothetical protein
MSVNARLDKVGFALSLGCSIHCALAPVVLTILPFIGATFLIDERFEFGLIFVSCALALTSLCYGYREHSNFSTFILFSMAILSFIISHMEEEWEAYLMAVAGATLALTHLINYWLCMRCKRCSH